MTRFLDTNVLLYAASRDPADARKSGRSREIMRCTDLALSTQVLGEFYVQALRQTRPRRLERDVVLDVISGLLRFPVQALSTGLVMSAIATQARFQISYWDAAIVEAARALGCARVLSEDLHDGMDFDGVRIENPFRDL